MHKKNKKCKIIIFAILLSSFVIGARSAQAQQKSDDSFQISPLRYDWNVNLNDDRAGSVFVKNNSAKAMNIGVDIEDFSVKQDLENNTNFFTPNENHPLKAYDVINWINIDKAPFVLEPGQTKEVAFTVHIPLGTPTGGYYGVIFFTKNPSAEDASSLPVQINAIYRMGTLLTFGVRGNEPVIEKGEMKLFEASRKVFIDNAISFNIQANNSGNIPYKVSGSIEIYKFGQKISTLSIAPNLLYPNRVRGINVLPWNLSMFDIGKYSARINLTSEDGNVVISGETSFMVIPWKLVAIAFFVFIALWVILNIGIINGRMKNKAQAGEKTKAKISTKNKKK